MMKVMMNDGDVHSDQLLQQAAITRYHMIEQTCYWMNDELSCPHVEHKDVHASITGTFNVNDA